MTKIDKIPESEYNRIKEKGDIKNRKNVKYSPEYIDKGYISLDKLTMSNLIYSITELENWGITKRSKTKIKELLEKYKHECRNDHFHKDNLYDEERNEEIRNNTLLVYYYLLGSFHIDTDKENILKPPTDLCLKNKRFDIDSF